MEQSCPYINQKQAMQPTPKRGLFTPDDMIWRVGREMIVLLGGSRALLMELAHPMVAAGVAQHSNYRSRPLRRLVNTLKIMNTIGFGTTEQARKAAQSMHQCHHHVHGTVGNHEGHFHAEMPYDATDPALRLWVFATLVDSNIVAYNTFMNPLTPEEQEECYAGWKVMASMMGIPASVLPETYSDFVEYVNTILIDGTLHVGETAQAILKALFGYPVIGLALRLISIPGIGLMPASLREAFGYRWTERDQMRLDRFAALHRRVRPYLPALIAVQPAAWMAEMRLRLRQ